MVASWAPLVLLLVPAGVRLPASTPCGAAGPGGLARGRAAITATVVARSPDVVADDLNATLDHAPLRARDARPPGRSRAASPGTGPTRLAHGPCGPPGHLALVATRSRVA